MFDQFVSKSVVGTFLEASINEQTEFVCKTKAKTSTACSEDVALADSNMF